MKIIEINYRVLTLFNEAYSESKELLKRDPHLTGVIILFKFKKDDNKKFGLLTQTLL